MGYQQALNRIWFEGWEKIEDVSGDNKIMLRNKEGVLLRFDGKDICRYIRNLGYTHSGTLYPQKNIEDIINEIDLTSTEAFDKEVGINK